MEFILKQCFKVTKQSDIRKVTSCVACLFAIIDTYTDLNTIANLFSFGDNTGLCTYQCSDLLGWALLLVVLTSVVFQAKVFLTDSYYGDVPTRCFFAFMALLGLGTIPVLITVWPKIGNDQHFKR